MTLDFSKGYYRDEQQVASDERHEKIDNWFKNRSVYAWKKCLVALHKYGEMSTRELSSIVNVSMSICYRRLMRQRLDSKVTSKKENNKFIWSITDTGVNNIFKMYKTKHLPGFLFEGV